MESTTATPAAVKPPMVIAPVVLQGQFVRLEPLAENHVGGLCQAGLTGEVFRWFTHPVRDRAGMVEFVGAALAQQRDGQALPFATIDQGRGQVAGSTRFGNIDRANRRVEIGWTWLGTAWQRTAINTEAKLLMLTHAFEAMGCVRVEFKTDRLNRQSQEALARLGAVEEGTFRQHFVCADGRLRDSVWFSIIDRDWPAVKAALGRRLARG